MTNVSPPRYCCCRTNHNMHTLWTRHTTCWLHGVNGHRRRNPHSVGWPTPTSSIYGMYENYKLIPNCPWAWNGVVSVTSLLWICWLRRCKWRLNGTKWTNVRQRNILTSTNRTLSSKVFSILWRKLLERLLKIFPVQHKQNHYWIKKF